MERETKELKYLWIARESFAQSNLSDTKEYYELTYAENPENPEAKYFHHFYDFMKKFKEGDIEWPFKFMVNSLQDAVEYASNDEWTGREKSTAILAITTTFGCIPQYITFAYENWNVDFLDICICGLYWLGSYIKTFCKEEQYYMEMAIEPWKKAVDLHLLYGCSHENYKIEEYVAEIQKYDPEYVMPEKPVENAREKKAREEAEKKSARN